MKASSFCARTSSSIILTLLFTLSTISQQTDLRDDLHHSFTKFDLVRLGEDQLRTEGGARTLSVSAAGKAYRLVIEPNDLRAPGYRAEDTNMIGVSNVRPLPVTTFKGKIAGAAASEVRLTIDGDGVEGYFQDAGDRIFIEPATKYSTLASPGDLVIYRAEDSLKDNSYLCESDLPGRIEYGRDLAASGTTENMLMLRVLELATEADTEWVNTHGGAAQANAEILSIMNMVEGTFSSEINLTIQVVYQHTWTTGDPYAAAADMNGILTSFRSYWNTNFTNITRDTTHLFSGKSIAQSRGLAYLGVVCRNPGAAYGISGYIGWAPGKFLVPAHELGHNVGADHAEAAQGCANSLMNATLTGATPLSFCSFSRDSITGYIALNNSCLSESSTAVSAPFDFDGDRKSDISVFRPSSGVWYLNRSGAGFTAFAFGLNGDKPVSADYDADGRADAAVYRNGVWYRLLSASSSTDVIAFGLAGDIPTPADFDGDNRADVAVFRPSNGVWYWLSSATGGFASVRFGSSGDVPLTGDYDGDGRDDINLFRPATGTWYRLNSSNGGFVAMNFGLLGDKPVAGDFDGDSKSDIAVWRPSNGVWYVIRSGNGSFWASAFGMAGDVPAAADFDGDGKTDISVFRPSNGVWYRMNTGNGTFAAMNFGLTSDLPVPSYYVP
jgi:hypothetical protein